MGVSWRMTAAWAWLALSCALLFAACGGGSDSPAAAVSRLRGGTIGVASPSSVQALELRFVLREAYSLEAGGPDGDVGLLESPAASLLEQLDAGEVDAILLSGPIAFGLLDDEGYEVLSHVSEEAARLLGNLVSESVLVTYPDAVERSSPALAEVNRMLSESVAYFDANRQEVIDAISAEDASDGDFQRWWWERHDVAFGDLSQGTQQQIVTLWQAAQGLGDIEAVPDVASVMFTTEASSGGETASARTTVSVAVLDDPSRRAALYALEQGLVASDEVDIDVNYLSQLDLEGAATTKQYTVVEAGPLAVSRATPEGSELIVLSGGVFDLDGTLLFVRRGR